MNNEYTSFPDETIRKIVGRNKIKYNILNDLFTKNEISNIKTLLINGDSILLDMHKYIKEYGKSDNDVYKNDIIYAITSSILNTIAHYRYYFILHDEYPKIYFFADSNDDHPYIRKAMEISKIILKYIPNAYFVDTKNFQTSIAMYYFKHKNTLIISRDEFDLMMLDDKTSILKTFGDKSKIYTVDNWQKVFYASKYDKKYKKVSENFLNIIECFAGAHGRDGVKKIGKRTIVRLIYKGLENNYIVDMKYSNIYDFIHDMGDLLSKYNVSNAIQNFNDYDITTNYNKVMTKAIEKRLDSNIEDKFSKKDLIKLNSKYFTGFNYLMLDELLMVPKSYKNK